jgi:hypothetical protein
VTAYLKSLLELEAFLGLNQMAHYAFLDENNIVTHVIVGKDEGEDGIDWEEHYGNFVGQTCKRTSYNTRSGIHVNGGTPFRKNYAGIGMIYDEQLDAFIASQPFNSWVLNESTGEWVSPIGDPPVLTEAQINAGLFYVWDEENQTWVLTDS